MRRVGDPTSKGRNCPHQRSGDHIISHHDPIPEAGPMGNEGQDSEPRWATKDHQGAHCGATPDSGVALEVPWGGWAGSGSGKYLKGGRWAGTQKFVYQKWPSQGFPTVNPNGKFRFCHDGHFGLGGGGFQGGGGVPLPSSYGVRAFQYFSGSGATTTKGTGSNMVGSSNFGSAVFQLGHKERSPKR